MDELNVLKDFEENLGTLHLHNVSLKKIITKKKDVDKVTLVDLVENDKVDIVVVSNLDKGIFKRIIDIIDKVLIDFNVKVIEDEQEAEEVSFHRIVHVYNEKREVSVIVDEEVILVKIDKISVKVVVILVT